MCFLREVFIWSCTYLVSLCYYLIFHLINVFSAHPRCWECHNDQNITDSVISEFLLYSWDEKHNKIVIKILITTFDNKERFFFLDWLTCIKGFFWGLNNNLFKVLYYYYVADYFCFCLLRSVLHPCSSKPIPMPLDMSDIYWALTLSALCVINSFNPQQTSEISAILFPCSSEEARHWIAK